MKKIRNSILVFTFVILASVIGSSLTSRGTAHRGTNGTIFLDPNAFYITDAFYGDFDRDGFDDDIKVIAVLDIDCDDDITSYLYLDIYLPSGNCFQFFIFVEFECEGDPLQFTFTTYNTALESGWYIADLTGYFVTEDTLYFGASSIIFDPPEGTGTGDPGVEVTVTSIDD